METLEVQGQVVELQLDKIVANPFQPRQRFDEDKIKELASSIEAQGLQQPIVVRVHPSDEGMYQIVMGERRWRAHKQLGRATIACIIRQYADEQMHELALIENLQRDDLTIMEEARSLLGLLEKHEVLQTVADKISKSITFVTRRLALLDLPSEVQAMLDEGKILPTHADVILDIEGAENQLKAAEMAAKLNLTAVQLHGRMLRHIKPKENGNGGGGGSVVKFQHVSGGVVRLYDAIEGYDFSMLRDANKRETLKRQITLLQSSLEGAITKLDLPIEGGEESSSEGDAAEE